MKQIICGNYWYNQSTATRYFSIYGCTEDSISNHNCWFLVPAAGVLRKFRMVLSTAPGAGKSFTYTVRKNGSDTSLAITITGAATTTGQKLDYDLAIAAGDRLDIKSTSSGTPAAGTLRWSFEFEGTDANRSIYSGSGSINQTTATTMSVQYFQGSETGGAVQYIPTNGTFKSLYVHLPAAPGAGKSRTFTLVKNGGATGLTVTISDAATTGNASVDVAITAGDSCYIAAAATNSPAGYYANTGISFDATVDGESFLLGGNGANANLANWATRYNAIPELHTWTSWTATESGVINYSQICVLKKLYAFLSGTPGSGRNYAFTVRKDGASPANGLVVTVVDLNTSASDLVHSITLADDSYIDIMCVPSGSPTTRVGYWSVVVYIAPAVVGWSNISKVNGVAAASIAKYNGVAAASIAKVDGVVV
jgi:hypothetical protein